MVTRSRGMRMTYGLLSSMLLLLLIGISSAATALQTTSSSSSQPSSSKTELKKWGKIKNEYAYANEFYSDNYGGKLPYFPERGVETIYDAREGVLNPEDGTISPATLEGCGFEVCHLPTKCKDFKDKADIAKHYLPELRSALSERYNQPITARNSFFWFGKIRGEDYDPSFKRDFYSTNPVMPVVHIDSNLDSYTTDNLVHQLSKTATYRRIPEEEEFDLDLCRDAIAKNQQRFLLINFWRSLGKDPVKRSPLGILQSRYAQELMTFPRARVDPTKSNWYVFPEMTRDECLIFKQYDRRLDQPSDLWHAAMVPRLQPGNVEQRMSYDVRGFIILDEVVPDKLNRFDAKAK